MAYALCPRHMLELARRHGAAARWERVGGAGKPANKTERESSSSFHLTRIKAQQRRQHEK